MTVGEQPTRPSIARPSIAELREVSQPESTIKRASGEHWAGTLYMRHVSIYITRALVPTPVTANAVTWIMLLCGVASAAVLALPHWWAAVIAFALIQLQGTLDCTDGELARWRGQSSAVGIYVDRLGHYVTDATLAVAVGVHADGGYASMNGWTMLGLATGFVVLLTKAETDLVHVARVQSGRERIADTVAAARSHQSLLRRVRSFARTMPFNRALIAIELTGLALIAAVVDSIRDSYDAMRVLDVALLAIAGIVVVGHLLATVTSDRLK